MSNLLAVLAPSYYPLSFDKYAHAVEETHADEVIEIDPLVALRDLAGAVVNLAAMQPVLQDLRRYRVRVPKPRMMAYALRMSAHAPGDPAKRRIAWQWTDVSGVVAPLGLHEAPAIRMVTRHIAPHAKLYAPA